jgi:hypothetical protein
VELVAIQSYTGRSAPDPNRYLHAKPTSEQRAVSPYLPVVITSLAVSGAMPMVYSLTGTKRRVWTYARLVPAAGTHETTRPQNPRAGDGIRTRDPLFTRQLL